MPGWLSRLWARTRRGFAALWKLLPALIVVGAVVALLKADPANRVEYVKALTWPLVATLGYLALRDLIHERLQRMSRVSLGGIADIDFAAQDALLEREAREVAAAIVPDATASAKATAITPPIARQRDEATLAKHQEEVEQARRTAYEEAVELGRRRQEQELKVRRDAVETALKAGAKWGYNMAVQYAEPPEPIIEWDAEGQPTISGAHGRRHSVSTSSQGGLAPLWAARSATSEDKVVVDAEDEVRRLEREYLALKGQIGGIANLGSGKQLEAARERLRRIDPFNHMLR
jgi:hypothetical protein